MKISAGKAYKRKNKMLSAFLISNPALVLGFDLPFLIATSTSLRHAFAMSFEMALIHMVTIAVSVIFARKLAGWKRVMVVASVATAVMMGARELVILMLPEITNTLGMYIYLMAINGLTLYEAMQLTPRSRLGPVLRREGFHVLSFVLTMFSLSLLREYFGSGTLWGIAVSAPFKLPGLIIPFCGFVCMGFLLALVKFLNRNIMGFAINETTRRQTRTVVRRY